MKKSNNLVLIGFMGVGKGTVGRELAKALNKFAIDGDDMIESFANKKIKAIFQEDGEEVFREIEKNLAKFLSSSVSNAIISTGGGFYKVKGLEKIGTIIYLKSSFEAILTRINASPNASKKLAKRPLLQDLEKAKTLHKEREKGYESKADITVNVEGKAPKQIVKEIKKQLKIAKFK
ncbi:shikimate kinase [Campylobacter geochelonis]|uniref:shikimate kinase n=1 Tax=Campylobacter geochelonis TaxID=1780362 RepID=UPI000770AC0E|nr:shikimate kinase [Campylobacter geochelonis]CZE50933.1 shikimate kinase [Campylobacter geochelonis]